MPTESVCELLEVSKITQNGQLKSILPLKNYYGALYNLSSLIIFLFCTHAL